jgi:hypothetical protein
MGWRTNRDQLRFAQPVSLNSASLNLGHVRDGDRERAVACQYQRLTTLHGCHAQADGGRWRFAFEGAQAVDQAPPWEIRIDGD